MCWVFLTRKKKLQIWCFFLGLEVEYMKTQVRISSMLEYLNGFKKNANCISLEGSD